LPSPSDPFAHHPELRGRITGAQDSFFRTFDVESLIQQHPQLAAHRDWVYGDDQREALRAQALADHSGDLWVFAYGSLMWDPALEFLEVRRARLQGYARRMILLDVRGGRGTAEAPGLMAALDQDQGQDQGQDRKGLVCEGLAFRIAAEDVERETEILWRREVVGPAYIPRYVQAELDDGRVQALTFLADHSVDHIRGDLSHQQQVHYIATGAGILGSSYDYLASIVGQFQALGIHDPDCASLLQAVEAYRQTLAS
jgi:cation transport protein ChaC